MLVQIYRRICDNPKCDSKTDFEIPLRPDKEHEISNWVVMTKEYVLHTGEQPQALTKIACSGSCAVEILRNNLLDLPKPKVH